MGLYDFKSDALHARFYGWLYDVDVTNYKTICPYFWKYVLTIIFLPIILPFIIIVKGALAVFMYLEDYNDELLRKMDPNELSDKKRIIKFLLVTFIVLGFCYLGKDDFDLIKILTVIIAMICGLAIFVAGIFIGALIEMGYKKTIKGSKAEEKMSIVGDMISSTYHKYCHRLTWDKEKNEIVN